MFALIGGLILLDGSTDAQEELDRVARQRAALRDAVPLSAPASALAGMVLSTAAPITYAPPATGADRGVASTTASAAASTSAPAKSPEEEWAGK